MHAFLSAAQSAWTVQAGSLSPFSKESEKAVEKNVVYAKDRDELLEYALKKKCTKVVMDIILL